MINEQIPSLKLDYTIKDMGERAALVDKIISQTPPENLTSNYLEYLADYIMNALTKEEKKTKQYLTDNRLITVNKRETSLEGLAEKFENGEDGIYNLMTDNKNILFTPKISITEEDVERVPGLKELRQAIAATEETYKAATGKRKYLLKRQLIEMRRDQYVLKNMYYQPIKLTTSPRGMNKIDLSETRWVDENGEPQSKGLISLFNPEHIAAILRHYPALLSETRGKYWDDFFYLVEDVGKLIDQTFRDYSLLKDILTWKMEGKTNIEIQQLLIDFHNTKYSIEYISSLWSKKIPKMIAEQEKTNYLLYYYSHVNPAAAAWKRCSCCKQWKLASTRFFSKNNTSKDGLYSQCKDCRNKKNKS